MFIFSHNNIQVHISTYQVLGTEQNTVTSQYLLSQILSDTYPWDIYFVYFIMK